VPSHAWNRWRYHYPQSAFPYQDLLQTNAARNRYQPEYELLDTGAFDDDRYWIVDVSYAKADPTDLLMTIQVTNAGPQAATLHVLPTAWFRNTWSWDVGAPRPAMAARDGAAAVEVPHPFLGDLELIAGGGPDGTPPALLFCENETNLARLYGAAPTTAYPKDGINDHVVTGAATVNPDQRGTKCSFWYQLTVPAGGRAEVRVRLRPAGKPEKADTADAGAAAAGDSLGDDFTQTNRLRQLEADQFYAGLTPAGAPADAAHVMRQAFAGLLWCKQFYYFDVARWLDGDPAQPVPPPGRRLGRDSRWGNFNAFDIMSMPDKWEYPWFAAWDLGFHCVSLAHVDPNFAKYQLILLCREWFQNPNGALPAYEWDFGDVNPPVQAWAALRVFALDGGQDLDFLCRMFDKLLINFTWWVNREDSGGNNVFEGGFLGLDNIGPIDRSHLPVGGILEQSDATGWMAFYAVSMASMATILGRTGRRPSDDITLKFLEHFASISAAINNQGLWDDTDGLFYDKLLTQDGNAVPVKTRSMVGVIPILAAAVVDQGLINQSLRLDKQFADFLRRAGADTVSASMSKLAEQGLLRGQAGDQRLLLTLVSVDQLEKVLCHLFDEAEFLSPYGLRALSAYHREHPYVLDVEGQRSTIDYEPAESTTAMFGGNSNWRGPIWFPLNYLIVGVLEAYQHFFGDELTIEYPSGSGRKLTFEEITTDLQDRLISIFLVGPDGRRPCYGWVGKLQDDPAWKDNLLFNEYYHGDNAAGLGASHQTGWTGVIADMIRRRWGTVPSLGDVMANVGLIPAANAGARRATPSPATPSPQEDQ
jgi:Mannosylglycerate hydrolase MGH1-like glycoside hydrolase domain